MLKSLGLVALGVLFACGGSDNVDIDGGTGGDAQASDGPTSNDGTVNDANPIADSGPVIDGSLPDVTPPFNPATVNGLVLWLEGDVSSSITSGNGRVIQWNDQTSHHNDAKGNGNVATRNPTVKNNQINSLSVVHFDKGQTNGSGNMLVVADNADGSLHWGTGDFFVAIVGEFDNDPKDSNGQNFGVGNFMAKTLLVTTTTTGFAFYGNIPEQNLAPSSGLLFLTSSTLSDYAYTATAYNDDKPHLFVSRRQGTTLDLYVDGASVNSVVSSANVDISNATASVRIGADGDANVTRLDGDIAEIYAVMGTSTSGDQQNIVSYLKKKWATP